MKKLYPTVHKIIIAPVKNHLIAISVMMMIIIKIVAISIQKLRLKKKKFHLMDSKMHNDNKIACFGKTIMNHEICR